MNDCGEPEGGGSAFPVVCPTETGCFVASAGLTKRQWYASLAMLGAVIGREITWAADDIAEFAFQQADAMIEAEEG